MVDFNKLLADAALNEVDPSDGSMNSDSAAVPQEKIYEERTVQAKLIHVLWKNSGFVIAKFLSQEKNKEFTGKGVLHPLIINCIYQLKGTPKWSHRYRAFELNIREAKLSQNNDDEGLVAYLASEAPNLGQSRAQALVKAFGKDVFTTLADKPEDVAFLPGLNNARALELQAWMQKEMKLGTVKRQLYGLGISSYIIRLLLEEFGAKAYDELKDKCFELTYIKGIGFLTVCKLAAALGVPANHPARIKAGVEYAIEKLMDNGHTCVPWQVAVSEATTLLEVHKNYVVDQIKLMLESKQLLKQDISPLNFVSDLSVYKDLGHDITPEQYAEWEQRDEKSRRKFLDSIESYD